MTPQGCDREPRIDLSEHLWSRNLCLYGCMAVRWVLTCGNFPAIAGTPFSAAIATLRDGRYALASRSPGRETGREALWKGSFFLGGGGESREHSTPLSDADCHFDLDAQPYPV